MRYAHRCAGLNAFFQQDHRETSRRAIQFTIGQRSGSAGYRGRIGTPPDMAVKKIERGLRATAAKPVRDTFFGTVLWNGKSPHFSACEWILTRHAWRHS